MPRLEEYLDMYPDLDRRDAARMLLRSGAVSDDETLTWVLRELAHGVDWCLGQSCEG